MLPLNSSTRNMLLLVAEVIELEAQTQIDKWNGIATQLSEGKTS